MAASWCSGSAIRRRVPNLPNPAVTCSTSTEHRAHGEQRASAPAEDLVLDVRVLAAAAAGRGMTVAAVGGWGEDAGGEGREVDAGGFDREAQRFVSRARTDSHEYLRHHAHMHWRM